MKLFDRILKKNLSLKGTNSVGMTSSEKGLYDLGMYFGWFREKQIDDLLNIRLSFLFAVQLVRWLHASLSKKTDGYTQRQDPALRAIFLLNNVNYLLKRLEKCVELVRSSSQIIVNVLWLAMS